jgi:prepilin-type N-terminal cleavage/methylation domain-containing protein
MTRRGMTLLELIVGLTVTGLVVTAGFAAVAMIGDRRGQIEAAMDTVAHEANGRAEIIAWVAGASLMADEGGPQFRGLDGVRETMPDDQLTFLTSSVTPLGAGGIVVGLYVDRDGATPERGLTAVFAEWRGTALKRVELDPRVQALDIRYLSNIQFRSGWLPSWISSTLIPTAVELRPLPARGDSLPPLLRLPILVPLRRGA